MSSPFPKTKPDGDIRKMSAAGPSWFPWRPFSNQIVLLMVKPEQRETDGGVILPESTDKSDKTTGIVVAHGPGEYLADGKFLSIGNHDDADLLVGEADIVFIRPGMGEQINVFDISFNVVTPYDILMVMKRDKWQVTKRALFKMLETAAGKWEGKDVVKGTMTHRPTSLPDRPSYEKTLGEAKEERRSKEGKATRTQIVVPPKGGK